MRRLTAYVMGSITAATGVTAYAFLIRPNFYSATVYLSQSNFSLMVLCNFVLVLAGTFMYTLQSFLFGPLRPLETEQLWERGWFAMMEWVFAMSTFRDEFGVWFLVMFISLFAGKIWGWIAEGRVEVLEQQAGNDHRLIHPRLVTSLAIYVGFAFLMFQYCLDVVVVEARPGMTIMFVFEFAILLISAISACARYGLWAREHQITRQQVVQAMEARKSEIRKQRQEAEEKIKADPEAEDAPKMEDLPKEEDVDENEIEAPGWEAKRGWLFALDIISDLLKLVAYMAFFTILTVFYGIPIYIIRDLYMTMRSFTKRVSDYLRFQAATRDMDTRYPNATAQDLAADNTCIVCREEMRPVDENGGQAGGAVGAAMHQRQKPKKLPCGHILHFGCLSSWLERQQACPICRRSVFATGTTSAGAAGQPAANGAPVPPGAPGAAHPPNPNAPRAPGQQPQNQGRVFRLGPLQVQIGGRIPGRHNDQDILNALGRLARQNLQRNQQNLAHAAANGGAAGPNNAAVAADANTTPSVSDPAISDIHPGIRSAAARMALNTIEAQIQREIQALNVQGARANTMRSLLNELDRARNIPLAPPRQSQRPGPALTPMIGAPSGASGFFTPVGGNVMQFPGSGAGLNHQQQVFPFARAAETSTAPPPGFVVPQGWALTPLNPVPSPGEGGQPQSLQSLQSLLQNRPNAEASSSRNVPLQNTMNSLNNSFQQFLTNAINGQPHVHTPNQGPFPPPPYPSQAQTPAVATNGTTTATSTGTNGSPGAGNGNNSSNEITPTATHTSNLPTPNPLPPPVGGAVEDVPPPPTAVQQSWNFPSMPTPTSAPEAQAPTSVPEAPTSAPEQAGKGKAPAVSTAAAMSVPQTHVEPPTPIATGRDDDGEHGGPAHGLDEIRGMRGKQARVEDGSEDSHI